MKKNTDNKHFWKATNPSFTDKIFKDEKIVLVEDDKVITAETDLAKIFEDHFKNIVESLHIERPCKDDFDRKPVVNGVKNFSQHPFFCLFLVLHSKLGGSTSSTKQFRPHKSYAKV